MTDSAFLTTLTTERTLAVVRAPQISDAAPLAAALAAGGISTIELTFTTPDVLTHIRRIADTAADHGATVGVGTVMTADQASAAIEAGAAFLVTPGIREEVARVARDAGVPFSLGCMTPTEVGLALDLGSELIKLFPARHLGPAYLKDLQGPFPGVKLLPSGGITEVNARSYLDAGALAVCCGTSVVAPAQIAAGEWESITAQAKVFVDSLG